MSFDTTIVGNNLDAGGNIKIALPNDPEYTGGIRIFSENDAGDITLVPALLSPETSQDYRLRVGMDTLLLTDTFNALTQNTNNWQYAFNTLTAAQPGAGTVNFSAVQGTTAAHGAYMRSFQHFPIVGTAPLSVEFAVGIFTSQLVANENWLMGMGIPGAATTPPIDGAWWKLTSLGWYGVISRNGTITESPTPIWPTANVVLSDLQKFTIIVGEQAVEFWRNDILLTSIAVPATSGQPFLASALPVFMQKYNTGAVSNTNTVRVAGITVLLTDIASNKSWTHQMATAGQGGYVGQNGQTQGQTALWNNNTAPTAVALTNTAAAFTGLGGISAVLPTLTANNDGILFSYQNPVPSINITGRNLVITGVKVQGMITVVLAGGPVIYAYAIAYGHNTATLVTAETASYVNNTVHAPRRVVIGIESYIAAAPVGTLGASATLELTAPIVVRPGEFVQIIARNMGTVTTTGAITIGAVFDAYWE